MKNENALILELCKFINPDKQKIEEYMAKTVHWPYVLGQLLFHRMGGAAYYVLRECGLLGRVNREVRNSLKIIRDSGKAKSEGLKASLTKLSEIINGAKFPYALLKGAYLVEIYPPGLRTSNDIDILIDQKDVSKLEPLLKTAGFLQGNIRNGSFPPASRAEIISSRMNRGETVPYIKRVDMPGMEYLEIDINFSLDFKAKQDDDIVGALLENSEPLIKTEAQSLFTLSPADFLIHLCCHLYKEAAVYAWVEMERDLSLYKFVDIYLLLNRWDDCEFYAELSSRICKYGLNRECYYALMRTKELFKIENAGLDKVLTNICPESTDYLNEIIQPEQNKKYRYDKAFSEWLFTGRRKEHLYEITNETA